MIHQEQVKCIQFLLLCYSNTYVENFETCNIQYTDEVLSLLFGVECFITFLDEEFEHPVEHGFRHGTDRVVDLVDITTLGDEFVTDLDPGFDVSLVETRSIDTQELGDAFTFL